MVEIKSGDTITAESVHRGTGGKGPYCMLVVKAEKGRDKITVWARDGEMELSDGDSVKINSIVSVKKSARKYQEKWYDTFDIVANLQVMEKGHASAYEESDSDGELPF